VRVDAPSQVVTDQVFLVNASGSTDNGEIANYTFTAPDGSSVTQTDPAAEFVFSDPGLKNITVGVTDSAGNQNSTIVSVDVQEADLPDLETEIAVDDEQRLQDGVTANVTVTNSGDAKYNSTFDVSVAARNDTASHSERTRFTVSGLTAGEQWNQTVDLTQFTQDNRLTGDLALAATAAAGTAVNESDTTNNNASATTRVTYSDLSAQLIAPQQAIKGENMSVFVQVRNEGSAASDRQDASLSYSAENSVETVSVPALSPGAVNRTEVTKTAQNGTLSLVVENDTLFADNNVSDAEITVEPYELSVTETNSPATIQAGSTFYVTSRVEASFPDRVNVSLETPEDVTLDRGAASREVFVRGSERIAWRVTADANTSTESAEFNVTAEAYSQTSTDSSSTSVTAPKIRVTDENATTLTGTNSSTLSVDVRNETTYEHALSVDVQAGSNGRTLKGLDYLVRYPYGCVEQTTSPMLSALNVDQYYRGEDIDYDQQKINGSIESGVERLEPSGTNGQHDNGAWSMYGSNPSGDLFYTVYALYGTSEVANDPVQSNRSEVAGNLSKINQTAAAEWLTAKQSADGSFESNHYYEDRRSMTGLTLISLEQADQAGAETGSVNEVRAEAVNYLLSEQNADGSWNDTDTGSAMPTALAVRGLATVTDEDLTTVRQTEVEAAIDDGTAYLHDSQNADGSWDPYHNTWSFAVQGSTSETTAHAVLAMNASGVADTNATVQQADSYLKTIYEEDGSWGHTRATAIAVEALQSVDSGASISQNVTVTVSGDGTVEHNQTVSLDADNTLETIELSGANNATLETLRNADDVTVTVETDGSGLIVTSVSNEQLINENEYNQNGGN
jgi:hypothetical protein